MDDRYGFPLCIQLTPPEHIYDDRDFSRTLELLEKKGFYGVELNITDFERTDPEKLNVFLGTYGLNMTMVASGAFAKQNGLSLSAADETVRKKTVEAFRRMVPFAERMGAGIICGFIKGGAGERPKTALKQMEKSVEELKQFSDCPVEIYLEATNHYEAALVNRVCEGAALAGGPEQNLRVLPDTYHMNMEENNMQAALVRYRDYYRNLHISDNNRYFPGFGAIDFYSIFCLLKQMEYQGTVSVEGRNRYGLREDIEKSCAYLEEIGKRLRDS